MAITVINRIPSPTVLKTVVCKNCGWEHSYAPIDVQESISHDYGGGSDAWWYIRCQNPACLPKKNSSFTGADPKTFGAYQTNYIEVKRPC